MYHTPDFIVQSREEEDERWILNEFSPSIRRGSLVHALGATVNERACALLFRQCPTVPWFMMFAGNEAYDGYVGSSVICLMKTTYIGNDPGTNVWSADEFPEDVVQTFSTERACLASLRNRLEYEMIEFVCIH